MSFTKSLFGFAFAVGAVFPPVPACAAANGTVFLGGAIYTLNDRQPTATALVVADGHIVYVGDDRGARPYVTKTSRVVRLHGRMLLPGFHDAHAHPMSASLRFLRCQLGGKSTRAALFTAIRACAASHPDTAWLVGYEWPSKAFERQPLMRAELDTLVPDRPAYIANETGFRAWANSRALAAAGVDPATNPSGLVSDETLERIHAKIPGATEAEYRAALKVWTGKANAFGITSVFDAAASPQMVEAYHAADLANELKLRIVAAQLVDPKRGPEQVDEMIQRRDNMQGTRFRADAAKIFLDGEIGNHTAALLQPYAGESASRGELYVQTDALDALVRRLDADGFMVHMHAMGDRAVRSGLDAIARAMAANGAKDRRHQIAHIELADPADLPRFAALDVSANLSPGWFSPDDPDMEPSEKALGPERAALMYPAASIASQGGRVVMSSDWPATALNPLENIQIAVTRQPLDGSKPAKRPGERLTLAAALTAYIKSAAYVAREDGIDGTLETGKTADLVVLDRNLFKIPARSIHTAHVVLTLLDGQLVYRDGKFAWVSH